MKFITFNHLGQERLGWLQNDDTTVLATKLDEATLPQSMADLVIRGFGVLEQFESSKQDLDELNLENLEILPPLEPDGIFCSAVNYYKSPEKLESDKKFDYPMLFLRLARNHVAHQQPLFVPKTSQTLDWEGELAAVIGKGGRHIRPEDALDHVFGYSIYNEGTVRGYGSHSSQVGMTKNFQASGSFGPCIVTADEFGNPYDHRIKTTVDGEVMQDGSVDLMIHRIEDQIAYISEGTELKPGDIVCTGTPAGMGVSMNPPRYLQPGQKIEVSIDGIGTLTNPIKAEPSTVIETAGSV